MASLLIPLGVVVVAALLCLELLREVAVASLREDNEWWANEDTKRLGQIADLMARITALENENQSLTATLLVKNQCVKSKSKTKGKTNA